MCVCGGAFPLGKIRLDPCLYHTQNKFKYENKTCKLVEENTKEYFVAFRKDKEK